LGIRDSVLGALQFHADFSENAELSENAALAGRPALYPGEGLEFGRLAGAFQVTPCDP
jgi:hypothetical protein